MAHKTLNVKDPEAYRLARKLSTQTGESLTQTVVRSLRERLERSTTKPGLDLVAEMEAIAKRVCALPELDTRSDEEILGYNEHGLLDQSHGH